MKKRNVLAGGLAAFLFVGSVLFGTGMDRISAAKAAQRMDYAHHPAKAAIAFGLQQGYMWTYPDGGFYPHHRISQAQFVAGLAAIRGERGIQPVPQLPNGHWAKSVYERANKAGTLRDIAIDPNRLLTKEEAAKLVFNAWRPYRGEKNKHYTNTGALVTWGWMKPAPPGQPKFREDLPVTRADAAEIFLYLWQDKWQLELGKKYADEFHRSLKVENGVISGRVPKGDGTNFLIRVSFITKENGRLHYLNGETFKIDTNRLISYLVVSVTNKVDSSDAGLFYYNDFSNLKRTHETLKFSNK